MTASILDSMKENKLKYIRFQFTDIFGFLRGVECPAQNILPFLEEGIGVDGSSIGFLSAESSDLKLIPDINTFQILPWNNKIGIIICDVGYSDGSELTCDPRTILKRQLKNTNELGFSSEVRPELEYYILNDNSPADSAEYMDLEPFDKFGQLRRQIMDYCIDLNIPVKYGHAEVGPGQQEIELGFSNPLQSADQVQVMKQCIRVLADQFDYQATFMPKPFPEKAGNGLHVHQRLFKNGKSVFGEKEVSKECKHYIGGLLHYAQNITAILNPITNSYKRMVTGHEAPVFLSWGIGNRTALIRVPEYEPSVRIEFRGADGSANIYLTYAIQIAAGLDGIKQEIDPSESISEDVGSFSLEERQSKNIKQLPESLKSALEKVEENSFVEGIFGKDLIEIFKKRKLRECKEFESNKNENLGFDWEFNEYINYG